MTEENTNKMRVILCKPGEKVKMIGELLDAIHVETNNLSDDTCENPRNTKAGSLSNYPLM